MPGEGAPVPAPRLPRLRPALAVAEEGETLLLRAEEHQFAIEAAPPWARAFFELLEGCHGLESIVGSLRDAGFDVSREDVRSTVSQLCELGLVEDASHDALLSESALDRYAAQLRYFRASAAPGEGGAHAQLRLARSRVAVLGLGALGGHIAMTLAAAGVGAIVGLDGDIVELSNLNRQTLYGEADVGRLKVEVARERIAAVNSTVRFTAERSWLGCRRDVERAVDGADFVVDAVDSPPGDIERWVNDACFGLGVPYVGMSHYPPWIRVGPTFIPGETGCYRCQEVAWRAEDPLFAAALEHGRAPATGPTALAVAGLVSMEVIHHLTGIARPASLGTAVLIDLRTLSSERRPVVRLSDCAVCRPRPDGVTSPIAPGSAAASRAPRAGAA